MGKIGSDARGVDDIVEGELINIGGELQEKRERLANATSSTEDGDLGQLQREEAVSIH